ncbi:MAG: putative metallopeptidase [Candidatus Bathyarchaeia archaeon]|nr:putative metallopeptidase [Candidatus Bathyarchaeota archaeon]
MPIEYFDAPDVKALVVEIVSKLGFRHVEVDRVFCFRSRGSQSRRVVARIHSLGKVWQKALNTRAGYLIEVISERYDKLTQSEKERVIIHELLHIPAGFSGGFRPHRGFINKRILDKLHEEYRNNR